MTARTPTRADITRALAVLEDLPGLVYAARTERGQSLRVAAEKIGFSYARLNNFENGMHQNPSLDTVVAMLTYIRGKK